MYGKYFISMENLLRPIKDCKAFARRLWTLSREGFLSCYNCCDTGPGALPVCRPWARLCGIRHYWFFYVKEINLEMMATLLPTILDQSQCLVPSDFESGFLSMWGTQWEETFNSYYAEFYSSRHSPRGHISLCYSFLFFWSTKSHRLQ